MIESSPQYDTNSLRLSNLLKSHEILDEHSSSSNSTPDNSSEEFTLDLDNEAIIPQSEASLDNFIQLLLSPKRKREEETPLTDVEIKTCGEKKPKLFHNIIKSESSSLKPSCHIKKEQRDDLLTFTNITVPESCSLFSNIKLNFKLESNLKHSLDLASISFSPLTEESIPPIIPDRAGEELDEKNQLWFSLNLARSDQQTLGSKLYLLLELYEKEENTNHRIVHFCDKCSKKRDQIIELQDKRIVQDKTGIFEASISINEQCAHRSPIPFGSPKTRFFFILTLFKDSSSSKLELLETFHSTDIKVVAPGKNRHNSLGSIDLNNHSTSSSASSSVSPSQIKRNNPLKGKTKVTTKQLVINLLQKIEKMDERLSSVEKKIAKLEESHWNLSFLPSETTSV